jgi:hypothetical protein
MAKILKCYLKSAIQLEEIYTGRNFLGNTFAACTKTQSSVMRVQKYFLE